MKYIFLADDWRIERWTYYIFGITGAECEHQKHL